MRILLTGATGFIGLEVARQLAAAGVETRVMVRRISRAPLLASLDVQPVHGDVLSPASLARAVKGADAVIHLAGRASFESYDLVRPTIVEGTTNLAEIAAEAGVERFVFASSLFVYDGAETITSSTVANPSLDYGRAKLEAEAALARVTAESGLRTACVRLPHVYGSHSLLFGLARRRLVVMPGSGRNTFAQLHVEDAARCLIEAACQGWTGTAPVADQLNVTWNEFFDVLTTYAPRIRVVHVPARLAAGAAASASPLLRRLGPTLVTGQTVRGWNLDLPVAAAELWSALDLQPRYPTVLEGIPAALDSSVAFSWRHPIFDWS
ncbi:MAG: NAD-dependent epimerase/dehydratase family protein [Acidimicrobiales bacterium]